jgi:hypothetical protein
MRKVWQTTHGPQGNCYAACLASILEVALADIPDFGTDGWGRRLNAWLGMHQRRAVFRYGDHQPLAWQLMAPRGWSIASCQVVDASVHAVVCWQGRMAHDPSPRPYVGPGSSVLLWTSIRNIAHALPTL